MAMTKDQIIDVISTLIERHYYNGDHCCGGPTCMWEGDEALHPRHQAEVVFKMLNAKDLLEVLDASENWESLH